MERFLFTCTFFKILRRYYLQTHLHFLFTHVQLHFLHLQTPRAQTHEVLSIVALDDALIFFFALTVFLAATTIFFFAFAILFMDTSIKMFFDLYFPAHFLISS